MGNDFFSSFATDEHTTKVTHTPSTRLLWEELRQHLGKLEELMESTVFIYQAGGIHEYPSLPARQRAMIYKTYSLMSVVRNEV